MPYTTNATINVSTTIAHIVSVRYVLPIVVVVIVIAVYITSMRYPGLEGTLLQARVDMDYVMEGIFTIPWFSAKGEATLRRHAANDRGDEVTIEAC